MAIALSEIEQIGDISQSIACRRMNQSFGLWYNNRDTGDRVERSDDPVMPHYYSIDIEFTKDKITAGFVKKTYDAIFETGFPFKSGYWFNEHMPLKNIIRVNQDKLKKGFRLGFRQHVKHNYKQILLDTDLFSEMRVFWAYYESKICLAIIVPEDDILVKNTSYIPVEENGWTITDLGEYYKNSTLWENKICPIIDMARNIWNTELPSMIQSGRELYHGGHFIMELDEGGLLCINPFCMVKAHLYERFKDRLNSSFTVEELCNDGFLIIDTSKIEKPRN
jgi:hypothetical protein